MAHIWGIDGLSDCEKPAHLWKHLQLENDASTHLLNPGVDKSFDSLYKMGVYEARKSCCLMVDFRYPMWLSNGAIQTIRLE